MHMEITKEEAQAWTEYGHVWASLDCPGYSRKRIEIGQRSIRWSLRPGYPVRTRYCIIYSTEHGDTILKVFRCSQEIVITSIHSGDTLTFDLQWEDRDQKVPQNEWDYFKRRHGVTLNLDREPEK